jgi:hypothetical protein
MIETKQPGKPTYRRFFIEKIFAETLRNGENVSDLWKRKIISHLNGEWDIIVNDYPSEFGRFHVEIRERVKYAAIKVGLYRDGFHIKVEGLTNKAAEMDLFRDLFGNPNKNVVWTQETEKVPKIVNQLIKELENY